LRPEAPQPISAASKMTGDRPRSIARRAALSPVYPPPMMAISAFTAPASTAGAGADVAVSHQSDSGCWISAIGCGFPSGGAAKLLFNGIGELAQRGEVVIRLRHFVRAWRPTVAFLMHPPFDPAYIVAKRPGDSNVMILALRDVQDVLLSIAESRLPPQIEREEIRVWLG